jgi:hypothetical protein
VVGKGAHDVTIQWSIFAESKSSSGSNLPVLVSTGTERVSMHHNLLIKGYERLPQAKYSDEALLILWVCAHAIHSRAASRAECASIHIHLRSVGGP